MKFKAWVACVTSSVTGRKTWRRSWSSSENSWRNCRSKTITTSGDRELIMHIFSFSFFLTESHDQNIAGWLFKSVRQSICLLQHTFADLIEKGTVICWLIKPTALHYVMFFIALSGIWSRSCICCPSSRLWIRWRPATLPSSWGPTSSGHELKGV